MKFSLYIHIPFCASICNYCDFYSEPVRDDDFTNKYIDALAREFEHYVTTCKLLDKSDIHTIYIGGGTPTVLPVYLWEKLYNVLLSKIDLSNVEEFSIECNPESFTKDHADFFAKIGVSRLTFGVQSLNDDELKLCNRPHNAKTALDVLNNIELLKPFNSIGVDIIYGLPNQTIESLDNTLTKILSIPHIKHLSAYELTIAVGTPFGEMYEKDHNNNNKNIKWADHDLGADMYHHINKVCNAHGFGQYEISNYARGEDHKSKHNIAYWSHTPYIGLGAGAHSHMRVRRFSNVGDVDEYTHTLLKGKVLPIDFEEVLTSNQLASEIIFLGARNINGIDEEEYMLKTRMRFDTPQRLKKLKIIERHGLIKHENKKWIPTSEGMLFADHIAAEIIDDLID